MSLCQVKSHFDVARLMYIRRWRGWGGRNTQYICCITFNLETLNRCREREREDTGVVTDTTLNTITWGEGGRRGVRGVCCSPVRPSGKGRLVAR